MFIDILLAGFVGPVIIPPPPMHFSPPPIYRPRKPEKPVERKLPQAPMFPNVPGYKPLVIPPEWKDYKKD